MKIKRLLYLVYYFRELDWNKLRRFMRYAALEAKQSYLSLWLDVILSCLRYNISILDFFHFHFYKLSHNARTTYAGTGFMYEYQLKMNPLDAREVLENKIMFLNQYKVFVRRRFSTLDALKTEPGLISSFLSAKSGRVVLKGSRGQVGAEVKILRCSDYDEKKLIQFMERNNLDLVEEFVMQHPDLMRLSPSGLNTIRIFTQLHNNEVIYLGARLRITINSAIDNMAAGNIAAPVDIHTGRVAGPGVFSDITKKALSVHPVTGETIIGFQVPFWKETLAMIEKAVFLAPQNKSIGWDIAISENGPELIEGNHNWCKLLWQMPVHKGLKAELLKFI